MVRPSQPLVLCRAVVMAAALLSATTALAVPGTVQVAARVVDDEGPVSRAVPLTFRLYNAPAGGAPLWEERLDSVVIDQGFLSVRIGGDNPLDTSVISEGPLLLELEIDGDVLTPRLPIDSVPYAILAQRAAVADRSALADRATRAEEATFADRATRADESTLADRASRADAATLADRATRADEATLADRATRADEATRAERATRADEATLADRAARADRLGTLTERDVVTTVVAGPGLRGGGGGNSVSLEVDFGAAQPRILGTCRSGEAMVGVEANGAVRCAVVANPGDITEVVAGRNLIGGAAAGSALIDLEEQLELGSGGVAGYLEVTNGAAPPRTLAALGEHASTGNGTAVVADPITNTVLAEVGSLTGPDKGLVATYDVTSGHPLALMTAVQGSDHGGVVTKNASRDRNLVRISSVTGTENGSVTTFNSATLEQLVQLGSSVTSGRRGFVGVFQNGGASATAGMSGDGTIFGRVKNFVVEDPRAEGQVLVYAALEGPESAMYIRGTGRLIKGRATVALPEHFQLLAAAEGMTATLTPRSPESLGLALTRLTPAAVEVVELQRGTGNYAFDYVVHAVRRGYEDFEVERPRSEFEGGRPRTLKTPVSD